MFTTDALITGIDSAVVVLRRAIDRGEVNARFTITHPLTTRTTVAKAELCADQGGLSRRMKVTVAVQGCYKNDDVMRHLIATRRATYRQDGAGYTATFFC